MGESSEMKQRLGMGVLLGLGLCLLLFIYPYSPWDHLFLLLLALVTLLGVREYCQLIEMKGEHPDRVWGYLTACAYPLVHGATVRGYLPQDATLLFWWMAFFSLLCLALFSPKHSLTRVALTFFGFCYVVLPLGEILTVAHTPVGGDDLRLWLFYGISITKLTDVAALFVGRYCGKYSLAPQVSPKKTWEGAAGGMLIGCLSSLLFVACTNALHLHFSLSYTEAFILGLILPIFGQVGDMVESLFKRDVGAKDSGYLPGLGGILDLVDSLLFTIPVLACFLRLRGTF